MKYVKISDLKGNEFLAKQILNKNNELLMGEGTILKEEYIKKLSSHGIEYVMIDEEYGNREKIKEVRTTIVGKIQGKVQSVLEQHIFGNAKELKQLCGLAENIITDVVEDDNMALEIANIKEHSSDIYSHSVNVSLLASLLTLKSGYSKEIAKEVATGCLLHDLGLRYVIQDYVDMNLYKLEEDELAEIKKHVIYGYDVLENETWISDIAKEIILCHHERIDGDGFPFKYMGEQIKKTTQIVAICDMFERMLSVIGCKKRSIGLATKTIKREEGKAFSSEIVQLFFKFIALYPIGTNIKLETGEEGVVEKQNPDDAEHPIVIINTDKNGKPVEPYQIDLSKEKNIKIDDLVL